MRHRIVRIGGLTRDPEIETEMPLAFRSEIPRRPHDIWSYDIWDEILPIWTDGVCNDVILTSETRGPNSETKVE